MVRPHVVIGAGIIGSTIARELAFRGIETLVLEKEDEPGRHASGRNSGVIHSGINHKPNSIKAKYCLEGSRRLREYCVNKRVPMKQCGTLVIARTDIEEERLMCVWQMGKELGVPELSILEKRDIRRVEPVCTFSARRAIYSPTGAIVDSKALLQSVIKDAQYMGAKFSFGERVKNMVEGNVITDKRKIEYAYLVNCGGLEADRLAHVRGIRRDLFIAPFKGSYWQIDGLHLKTMIYAPPNPKFPFLGIHLTPTTEGLSLAGPNAALAFGRESYGSEVNIKDLAEMIGCKGFWKMARKRDFMQQAVQNLRTTFLKSAFLQEINGLTSEKIDKRDVIPYRAGIRARLVDSSGFLVNDIVVHHGERETHVLNAVSPGMTCSLAFAENIVDFIGKKNYS